MLALATLLASVTALFVQLARVHTEINSRMTQLLALTRSASHAAGVLEGVDQVAKESQPPESASDSSPRGAGGPT